MYFKNLKKTRIFQKLNLFSIPLIQFEKNVASLTFKAKVTAFSTSSKKNLGPRSFWKPATRVNHIEHLARSVKVREFSIKGFNFNKTFLPEQCSMKRTNVFKYQGLTLADHREDSKLLTNLRCNSWTNADEEDILLT